MCLCRMTLRDFALRMRGCGTRHGIGWLDALTQAAAGNSWMPETG
jgi:hypothetical protein